MHTPSEHTVDGQHADLELQLLFENKDKSIRQSLAVLFNTSSDTNLTENFDFFKGIDNKPSVNK